MRTTKLPDDGVDRNEPGLQDSTVMDFLLPLLGGSAAAKVGEMAPAAAEVGAPLAEDAYGSAMREGLKQVMSEPAKGMPHFDRGIILPDDPTLAKSSYDVNLGDSSTAKAPPMAPPPPPDEDAEAPVAAAAAPAPPQPAAAPSPKLPGMPASVTPDQLQQYLQGQRAAINKYSPDDQYATEQRYREARTGPLGAIAHAAATFAGPEYANAQDQRWQQGLENAAGSQERAREGTQKNVGANQQIDAQDPSSPLSQSYQKAFGTIFKGMGYSMHDVSKMPASQIQTVADLGVRYADAATQLELKRAMLGVQTMSAAATMANAKDERRQAGLKELQSMPWYSRLIHPGVAAALEKEAGLQGGGAADHPEASTALAWAQKNPKDPRAAEIMKRLGQ